MTSAETVVLTLQEQISGPAEAATGGLSLLERKILQSQAAIARLEQAHARAAAQLAVTAAGDQGLVDVAGYRKQESAVANLSNRIESAKQRIMYVTEQAAAKEQSAADKSAAAQAAASDRIAAMQAAAVARAQASADRKAATEAAAADRSASMQAAAADRAAAREEAAQSRAATAAERAAEREEAASQKKAEEEIRAANAKAEAARRTQSDQDAAYRGLMESGLRLLGPMGEQIKKVIDFGKALSKLPPQVAAVVVAIMIVVGVLVAVGAAFVAGVKAAGAYRDELLKLAGASGGSMTAARELQDAVTSVASASALGREKVADLAGQLAHAGLSGGELKRALEAAAIASSAGGDQMANDFIKAAEAAKKTGGSVDALSKAMKDKLGGVAAAQALSFGVQIDKLKENLQGLFSGADITPLLTAMHALLSIFDQTTATGQAMRAAIGGAIESIIGVVLRVATAAVKLYVALKSNSTAWAIVTMAAKGLAVVFGIVAGVIGLVVAALAIMAGAFMVGVAIVGALIGRIWGIVGSIASAITSPFATAKAWLSSFSLSDVGSQMISGLVNGITSNAGAILSAIMAPVKNGVAAVKNFLGISSPSRVFADIGGNVGAGMVVGVDATAGDVQASTEGLADAAVTGASAGKKAAGALGAKGGASTGFAPNFSNCNFVGTTQREVEAMMRAVFEAEYLDAGAVA